MSAVILISCSFSLSETIYTSYYAECVKEFERLGYHFVLFGDTNISIFVQSQLLSSPNFNHASVTIYDKGAADNRIDSRFVDINGFTSTRELEIAMVGACTAVLEFSEAFAASRMERLFTLMYSEEDAAKLQNLITAVAAPSVAQRATPICRCPIPGDRARCNEMMRNIVFFNHSLGVAK